MPFANNKGVKIHYEVEGQGPPLVLQHGFSATYDSWRTNGYTEELSKDCQLIMLDARGRGQSDKPHDPKEYTFEKLVSDFVAVLDDLKTQKAHYYGYSMGAAIGFRIPIYAPSRFYSLILGGATYPLTGVEIGGFFEDLAPVYDGLVQAVKEGRKDAMEVCVALYEKRLGPMTPDRKARTLAQDPQALAAAWEARKASVSPKASEYLPKITHPCLLFVGEKDPRFSGAKESAGMIPKSQFFSLAGLNHSQSNQGKLVVPHIKKFLAEVSKNMPN